MSLEYVEKRIKEALKKSGGNPANARQQIIAWTYEDEKLLHALAKPHLNGIVAYNVERVASGRADASRAATEVATQEIKPETKPAPAAKPKEKEESFGMEILKAIAGSEATFGLEDLGVPQKRRPVSKKHIDAIRSIAGKNPLADE